MAALWALLTSDVTDLPIMISIAIFEVIDAT